MPSKPPHNEGPGAARFSGRALGCFWLLDLVLSGFHGLLIDYTFT
jgi:hypothetical protein